MTYDEAIEATIPAKQARHEISVENCHGEEGWQEFIQDHGNHAEYPGEDILNWLGY